MKENRVVFVDYLRVVACFLVMLVHASENFYAADASGLAGNQANPLVPVWLAIPCIAMLTFICCAVTTKLISYVPGSKWIIG